MHDRDRTGHKQVAILQHRLLHYRQEFFEKLRYVCADRGVDLHLVHGQPSESEALKKDVGVLPWANEMHNRFVRIGNKDLLWQPYPSTLRAADLVVLIQENRILSNYPWLLRWGVPEGQRVAYWGHGRNLQSTAPDGLREQWKKWFINRVDWWFAYTDTTRALLQSDGFPLERISVLNNAIDNDRFVSELASVTTERLQACYQAIKANPGDPVALYCGSLYLDKRLELMIEAADIVYAVRPDFRLVVIGDGPARSIVTAAASTRPWLHWDGVRRGVEKAAWFRISNAYFSPGAVGLHVLDAFCAGIPMITTDTALHGPEIAYLRSGHNGFIVKDSARAFSGAYLDLISDESRLQQVISAATSDASLYTLDNMVQRFAAGIDGCLSVPPRRR